MIEETRLYTYFHGRVTRYLSLVLSLATSGDMYKIVLAYKIVLLIKQGLNGKKN